MYKTLLVHVARRMLSLHDSAGNRANSHPKRVFGSSPDGFSPHVSSKLTTFSRRTSINHYCCTRFTPSKFLLSLSRSLVLAALNHPSIDTTGSSDAPRRVKKSAMLLITTAHPMTSTACPSFRSTSVRRWIPCRASGSGFLLRLRRHGRVGRRVRSRGVGSPWHWSVLVSLGSL